MLVAKSTVGVGGRLSQLLQRSDLLPRRMGRGGPHGLLMDQFSFAMLTNVVEV